MSHISSSRQDGLATYGHFHQQLAHEAAADHLRRAAASSQGQAGVEELAAGSEARISAFVHWARASACAAIWGRTTRSRSTPSPP